MNIEARNVCNNRKIKNRSFGKKVLIVNKTQVRLERNRDTWLINKSAFVHHQVIWHALSDLFNEMNDLSSHKRIALTFWNEQHKSSDRLIVWRPKVQLDIIPKALYNENSSKSYVIEYLPKKKIDFLFQIHNLIFTMNLLHVDYTHVLIFPI